MTITEFIQDRVLLERLQQTRVLVVYDRERRYRALCLALAAERRRVIDASDGSIESREAALTTLQHMGSVQPPVEQMLIYVPAEAPLTEEQMQRDPFAVYTEIGSCFPDPLKSGDEYQALCLRFKPDHATAIRSLFQQNPNPDFAMIDAIGAGSGWPQLQAHLGVESARAILLALLAPSEPQKKALKAKAGWWGEAKALLHTALGLQLLTRVQGWETLADELWRYLLFSEFVFDLPEGAALPATLESVPRAPTAARALVEDLCESLRSDQRTQGCYIDRAVAIEGRENLNLPDRCRAIDDLGIRDTFPFEERSFFAQAVTALANGDGDRQRQLVERHRRSLWANRGENKVQWSLLRAAIALVAACEDAERQLPDYSRNLDALLDYYVGNLREVDRLQRELEQAAADADLVGTDLAGTLGGEEQPLDAILGHARRTYRHLIDRLQPLFIKQVERSGWPPLGRLANAAVFDKYVAPRLKQSGQRVALLLIDALRFELGVELQKQLGAGGQVDLAPAFAQAPTVTPVGMASLLPGAEQGLALLRREDRMTAALDGQLLPQVTQRMEVLRSRYGQRFGECALKDFARGKANIPATVELLVLRSNEMDEEFEHNPEAAYGQIVRTLQQVQATIGKLRTLGFQEAIIVADHGFYLHTAAEAGDICQKPPGNWIMVHGRMLLGDGAADASNLVMPAAQLGIRGDFSQAAVPRGMVPYQGGMTYFHGGLSLQEAVVPVLVVRLRPPTAAAGPEPEVSLRYKRGSKRVTTPRPVFEVSIGLGGFFTNETPLEILIEAYDKQGRVVGEALHSPPVNPATGTLTLRPGESADITLRLNEEYEGKLVVKALNPTKLTEYDKARVELETDYTR